jgi:hypothetical protein
MAPFALFNHRSFRRGASSQLTSVPESASAQMGAVPSRVAPPHVSETPHKKLRPRSSSLNILKRTRTPSGKTLQPEPEPSVHTTTLEATECQADYTRTSLGCRSGSETTVKTLNDSVHSSKSLVDSEDASGYGSDTSSTGTATRVTPPSEQQAHPDDEPSGMTTPVPPPPPKTPQIQLPTPPFLTEDSPTKYGLRLAHTPSPDRSMAASQRQKMTGAGLFVVCCLLSNPSQSLLTRPKHAATQQRSTTLALPSDQAKSGAVDVNHPFARSSPSLPLSDKTNLSMDQSNSLPSRKLRPNLSNPFKDAPQEHVAHALPLRRSQKTCFRNHDLWQRMGSNYRHAVACAVCDGYEAPGDDFMTCLWCELHVCGKCYSAFVSSGMAAMMERQPK